LRRLELASTSAAPASPARGCCAHAYPRKSNSPSGTLQIRVFSSLTVSFSLPMISCSRRTASSALPFRHRITRSSARSRCESRDFAPARASSTPTRTGACTGSPAEVRGRLRTDRGRRGLLLLHRSGLSPHTPCQSPGALTRVTACTLAPSPYIVTRYRRLQPFRFLHSYSGCFRLERLPGGPCSHWKAPPLHGARQTQTLWRPLNWAGSSTALASTARPLANRN
jgi:hypothetical protein